MTGLDQYVSEFQALGYGGMSIEGRTFQALVAEVEQLRAERDDMASRMADLMPALDVVGIEDHPIVQGAPDEVGATIAGLALLATFRDALQARIDNALALCDRSGIYDALTYPQFVAVDAVRAALTDDKKTTT